VDPYNKTSLNRFKSPFKELMLKESELTAVAWDGPKCVVDYNR